MGNKSKIFRAWKNLGANLTQKKRFKKDIEKRATAEAKKIGDKLAPSHAGSEKMPKFDVPAGWTKEKQARQNITEKVKEKRKKQAKKRGII